MFAKARTRQRHPEWLKRDRQARATREYIDDLRWLNYVRVLVGLDVLRSSRNQTKPGDLTGWQVPGLTRG